ncbi:hypothetical protein, partial [Klebsiella pneumoniae]|uniref:hypothetical protein n=1 Tax=Klebsiella pneumoniae TaxID=573 RepID=UPI0019539770
LPRRQGRQRTGRTALEEEKDLAIEDLAIEGLATEDLAIKPGVEGQETYALRRVHAAKDRE